MIQEASTPICRAIGELIEAHKSLKDAGDRDAEAVLDALLMLNRTEWYRGARPAAPAGGQEP